MKNLNEVIIYLWYPFYKQSVIFEKIIITYPTLINGFWIALISNCTIKKSCFFLLNSHSQTLKRMILDLISKIKFIYNLHISIVRFLFLSSFWILSKLIQQFLQYTFLENSITLVESLLKACFCFSKFPSSITPKIHSFILICYGNR